MILHQDNRAKADTLWGGRLDPESIETKVIGKNLLGKIWMSLRDNKSTRNSRKPKQGTSEQATIATQVSATINSKAGKRERAREVPSGAQASKKKQKIEESEDTITTLQVRLSTFVLLKKL